MFLIMTLKKTKKKNIKEFKTRCRFDAERLEALAETLEGLAGPGPVALARGLYPFAIS